MGRPAGRQFGVNPAKVRRSTKERMRVSDDKTGRIAPETGYNQLRIIKLD